MPQESYLMIKPSLPLALAACSSINSRLALGSHFQSPLSIVPYKRPPLAFGYNLLGIPTKGSLSMYTSKTAYKTVLFHKGPI